MVSRLVDEDAGNRTSEEEIMSGSEGPDVSERVQMAMEISRPTTAQMVLGREALYLPDNHPLLQQIQSSVAIQGRVLANSDGPALTRLELTIHMADDKANVMDMVIFRTIFFELFSFLHIHAPCPPFRLLMT